MCGRIAQSETRRYYAHLIRPDFLERKWTDEDSIPQYDLSPSRATLLLPYSAENSNQTTLPGATERLTAAAKQKPWIKCTGRESADAALFPPYVPQGSSGCAWRGLV